MKPNSERKLGQAHTHFNVWSANSMSVATLFSRGSWKCLVYLWLSSASNNRNTKLCFESLWENIKIKYFRTFPHHSVCRTESDENLSDFMLLYFYFWCSILFGIESAIFVVLRCFFWCWQDMGWVCVDNVYLCQVLDSIIFLSCLVTAYGT